MPGNKDYVVATSGVRHKITDNRRGSIYKRHCSISVSAPVPDSYPWHDHGKFTRSLVQRLRERFPEHTVSATQGGGSHENGYFAWVSIERFWRADKPSLIICQLEADAAFFITQEHLEQVIECMTEEIEAERITDKRRERDTNIVLSALDQLRKETQERAQTVCRYKQRLAALEAEYKAEYEAQTANPAPLEATLAEWVAYPEDGDDHFTSQLAGVVRKTYAKYCAARGLRDGGGFRFPSCATWDSEKMEAEIKDLL